METRIWLQSKRNANSISCMNPLYVQHSAIEVNKYRTLTPHKLCNVYLKLILASRHEFLHPCFEMKKILQKEQKEHLNSFLKHLLLRLPVGYGGVLNSPRFCFLLRLPVGYGGVLNSPRFCFFFPVSKVGLPLMGDTAVQYTDC